MPLDYSKWDNLEISDDEDIEVHPNVDKKSFIKWNQEAIHYKRAERRNKIAQLKERIVQNSALILKINEISDMLKTSDVENFMKTLAEIEASTKDTVNETEKTQPGENRMYSNEQSILNLLRMVTEKLASYTGTDRKEFMLEKIKEELFQVETFQLNCKKDLEETLKIENSTLTSDNICRVGFDKTIVNKPNPQQPQTKEPKKQAKQKTIETLNADSLSKKIEDLDVEDEDGDNVIISNFAYSFAKIKSMEESKKFISKNPHIVNMKYSDEIMGHALEVELEKDTFFAKQCIVQSLAIKYCIELGPDGINLFFNRLNQKAAGFFYKDVEDTYALLKQRCEVLRSKLSNKEENEVLQLEALSADGTIKTNLPDDSEEDKERFSLFLSLPTEFQEALKLESLIEINKLLAKMRSQQAEEILEICAQGNFILFGEPENNQNEDGEENTLEEVEN